MLSNSAAVRGEHRQISLAAPLKLAIAPQYLRRVEGLQAAKASKKGDGLVCVLAQDASVGDKAKLFTSLIQLSEFK